MDQGAPPGFLHEAGIRLLLFGGKGGVGKTTCAAAAALFLAGRRRWHRVLLVSTDPAHSLADAFAGQEAENLVLCEIDPMESLARFKQRHADHLGTIAWRGTFLDETDISRLLALSIPGLDEVVAFLEIAGWVADDRYDTIVVDTAPAGHTLRFLGLPEVMRRWLEALDAMMAKHRYMVELYRGTYEQDDTDHFLEETAHAVAALLALLGDRRRCRFVPVMTAEPLSLSVTRKLVADLERLRIPVPELIVNRLCAGQAGCPLCADASSRQAAVVREAAHAFPDARLWGLPLLPDEPRGAGQLAPLAAQMVRLDGCGARTDGTSEDGDRRNGARGARLPAVVRPTSLPPRSLRLLLFAGKGGVGKTTLACASALRLTEEWTDKEILLFSIDPAHSISACLGRAVGPSEVRVSRGLTAVEMDAQADYERFKQTYADELAGIFTSDSEGVGVDLSFDREALERVMDLAPPGLDEVLAVTRIVELMEQDRYDLFILDTAPTGHLLRFLETPELIEQWLKTLFALFLKYRSVVWLPTLTQELVALSKRIKGFRHVLQDPDQAGLMATPFPPSWPTKRPVTCSRDAVGSAWRCAPSSSIR